MSIGSILYTGAFVGLFAFTASMIPGHLKDGNVINAAGNFIVAIFCLLALLVRFGIIAA